MSASKSSNLPRFSPLQRGAIALLKRNLPLAYESFSLAYQSTAWQQRDQAVTGWGDLFDSRLFERDKTPSVTLAMGWQPPPIALHKPYVPNQRLLVLRDSFLHPAQWRPQNLAEQKSLHALRAAKAALERVLVNDASVLVRTSAVILLWEYFGDEHPHTIQSAMERALRREKNPTLRFVLKELLKSR